MYEIGGEESGSGTFLSTAAYSFSAMVGMEDTGPSSRCACGTDGKKQIVHTTQTELGFKEEIARYVYRSDNDIIIYDSK